MEHLFSFLKNEKTIKTDEVLLCIRLLTRCLPVLLEIEAQELESSIFWADASGSQVITANSRYYCCLTS
jgi:hypothetical protein